MRKVITKKFLIGRVKDLIKLMPLLSIFRSKSYSQSWEDRTIHNLLNINVGTYIDIGAGTPIWGSNTYFFYKRGWTGVTVDPIDFNIKLHKLLRPKDKQYRNLVNARNEKIDFFEMIPWEYSTTDEQLARIRESNGAIIFKNYKCESISLKQLYETNPINRPAILSIDVEGAEIAVIESNDWNQYKPDVICIEELNNPIYGSMIRTTLESVDYKLYSYNGLSSVYIWNKTQYLKDFNSSG